ncbi:hypothetical protein PIB30_011233 [Stylosanthes scabra]|uniref:Uncharacterized protein n=1 Tax=Stylosanthes scabra TaxID=79078 RepID=A0ABU6T7S8_9FABA|nr:hypothetical protein [Stylosanthes scabra]
MPRTALSLSFSQPLKHPFQVNVHTIANHSKLHIPLCRASFLHSRASSAAPSSQSSVFTALICLHSSSMLRLPAVLPFSALAVALLVAVLPLSSGDTPARVGELSSLWLKAPYPS